MTNSKTSVKALSEAEFQDFLRAVIEASGGLGALSRQTTLDKTNLSKSVRGKRKPGPMLLKSLGIRAQTVYILPARWVEWLDSRG